MTTRQQTLLLWFVIVPGIVLGGAEWETEPATPTTLSAPAINMALGEPLTEVVVDPCGRTQ